MTPASINIFLVMAVVALSAVIAAAWFEPTVADRVVLQLRARAAGVRARRKAYREARDGVLNAA